jgi:flagellar hook-basal body complex protein FliE
MASPLAAASAYANIARLATDPSHALANAPGVGAGTGTGNAGGSFASLLKDAIGAVGEAGRKSDAQTQALANGKSNMVDVVTAVAETEVAVDAVVAVRDKVIAAYDEIMKMPI